MDEQSGETEEASHYQRTEINGESTYMVWTTLGLRTAKEQNRTKENSTETIV